MAIRLSCDEETRRALNGKIGPIQRDFSEARRARFGSDESPLIIGLSGSDSNQMALISDGLISDGHKLVLVPTGLCDPLGSKIGKQIDAWMDLDRGSIQWAPGHPKDRDLGALPPFDIVFYTSGSTGKPKGIGVSLKNLRLTTDWYRLIYRLDRDAVVLTSMPFTYNFSFVAGFCQSLFFGTGLLFGNPEQLHDSIRRNSLDGRRTILLANPVILESLFAGKTGLLSNVLVDSGGAPVSKYAVQAFRDGVADLREGYGLSETCSLTHFDLLGTRSSLGSVGQPMPGVVTELRKNEDHKPELWMSSPNVCEWVETNEVRVIRSEARVFSGDLASTDDQGNLRLLGRADDVEINGFWPRDTLDALGSVLGDRCAMVRHENNSSVVIRLWRRVRQDLQDRVVRKVSESLGISKEKIRVENSNGLLLHSFKIPRK